MLVHFALGELLSFLVLLLAPLITGNRDFYYSCIMEITGLTGVFSVLILRLFYRRDLDERQRKGILEKDAQAALLPHESVLLFLMGIALCVFGNILLSLFSAFIPSDSYSEMIQLTIGSKPLLLQILWLGILAPAAEEAVFRWEIFLRIRDYHGFVFSAVFSAIIFGIYHGNVFQGVYAAILGFYFAFVLEMSGNRLSCVFLHASANVFSLVLMDSGVTEALSKVPVLFLLFLFVLAVSLITGTAYFYRKGHNRACRAV